MTLSIYDWENPLLAYAHKAICSDRFEGVALTGNKGLAREAYAYCDNLTAKHSRSFYLASRLLSIKKRQAIRALYAFCRTTDDIVDQPSGDAREQLFDWRRRVLFAPPRPGDLIPIAWSDTCTRFQIPRRYAEQLIDGVARDLTQTRYATFAELAEYCYGVASTVGLLSMHIVGFDTDEAIPYAVRLGVALQLTNILRDIGEDWGRGRFYLPQDELADFGLSETDVARGVVTDAWRDFMRFQIARNRRLYAEAWPGIGLLHRDGHLAISAAADFYSAILNDIEAYDYDVFSRRAYVSGRGKLQRLPKLWWRSKKLLNC